MIVYHRTKSGGIESKLIGNLITFEAFNQRCLLIEHSYWYGPVKFMFSKNATKIYEIFTVDLTLCSKCQIRGEDFVNFCGLRRTHRL